DLEIVGAPGGGRIESTGAPVLTVAAATALRLDGVDLTAIGPWRVIDAGSGGSALVVRNAELEAGGLHLGGAGGLVRIVDPLSVDFDHVVLRGTPGVDLTGEGGGIWAMGAAAMRLTDVTFVDVEASGNGGAIFSSGLPVTCVRCTFDHTAGGQGGAIHVASATLDVEQSRFCATRGTLGGAIFASSTTDIRSSVFTETYALAQGAVLYANGGDWRVRNVHVLGGWVGGISSTVGMITSLGSSIEVRNSLFAGTGDLALDLDGTGAPPDVTYNWFYDNSADADLTLDATNTVGLDPVLVRWSNDGDCSNDEPWPTPVVSPLLDAGDPGLFDLDGTRSDIGAYGGPSADASLWVDDDSDGLVFFVDCDDTDPAVSVERAWFADCDHDGQGTAEGVLSCFSPPLAPPACGLGLGSWATGPLGDADCDDADPAVYRGAPETCAEADEDCDGHPYAGAVDARTWYLDLDGDGSGGDAIEDCGRQVPGWVREGGDCDDADPDVFPDAPDPCGDGVDQDCDGADGTPGLREPWYADADGDGFGDPASPPVDECLPGLVVDHVPNAADCDDGDASISPAEPERCDGVDRDCNGIVDDTRPLRTWYADVDGDGLGNDEVRIEAGCAPEGTWVLVGGDCDDDSPSVVTCGCGGCAVGGRPPSLLLFGLLLLGAFRARSARAQTFDGDLEALADPTEVPNATDLDVPGWIYGDGVDPQVQAQVAAVGVPIYCEDLLLLDSPSNLASQGYSRHFAHAEALNLPPVAEVNEWLATRVDDLDPALAYQIRFEASIVRHIGQRAGFWRVTFDGVSEDAPLLVLPANPGQQQWVEQTVGPFTPGTASAELRFEANATTIDPGTVTPLTGCGLETIDGLAQLLLDGIDVVPDTDGDGIFDRDDPCPASAGPADDQDDDGLDDGSEEGWGTDPCDPDTDGDGLTDGVEVALALDRDGLCPDPAEPDSDGDTVTDGAELQPDPPVWLMLEACDLGTTTPAGVALTSDPCTAHSDDDGLSDDEEWARGTDPRDEDSDGDGIVDHVDPAPLVCGGLLDTADTGLSLEALEDCCANGGNNCCEQVKSTIWVGAGACRCAGGAPGPGAALLVLGLLIARRRRTI
ncbi:MAG: MopE-related protein, partial [Myxococcota bacterium]